MSRPNAAATADVDLLRVFSTLMDERSLARAATRLGRSRHAVDTALRHLRRIFGDPLLLKDGPRMAPTERALALEAALRERGLLNQNSVSFPAAPCPTSPPLFRC